MDSSLILTPQVLGDVVLSPGFLGHLPHCLLEGKWKGENPKSENEAPSEKTLASFK